MWRKAFLFLLITSVFSTGCKDENEIGLNVLPPSDQIGTGYNDTSTIITSTVLEDSLRTDELSLQLLGSDNDPVFGRSTASIFTQVTLEGIPAFADSVVADSLVLSLAYFSHYGDTNQSQTVNVYRMSEPMYVDSNYFSSRYFLNDSMNAIGNLTFQPKPLTLVYLGPDSTVATPQIRIKLSQSLADSLLAYPYTTNADFLSYFKGLYIKAEPTSGPAAISYLNFFFSSMTLYFHDSTKTYNYNYSLKDARLNYFTHDYTGAIVQNNIGSETDSVNYMLSMCGLKTKISFPNLKHFTDLGSILVNRAELVISAQLASPYSPLPSKLILVTRDASGTVVFPIDYYETSGYFGGGLNASSSGYSFNITRQVQQYLQGIVPNADFILAISGSGVEASRAVLRSPNANEDIKMKLKITYTKTN